MFLTPPPPELQGPSFPSMALTGSVHFMSTRGGGWGPVVPRCVLMSQHPQRSLTDTSHLSAVESEWAGREGQLEALLSLFLSITLSVLGTPGPLNTMPA